MIINLKVWPNEVETLVQDLSIPSASLNIDLNSYVDILCSVLDIPIYKSRIQVKNRFSYQQLINNIFRLYMSCSHCSLLLRILDTFHSTMTRICNNFSKLA